MRIALHVGDTLVYAPGGRKTVAERTLSGAAQLVAVREDGGISVLCEGTPWTFAPAAILVGAECASVNIIDLQRQVRLAGSTEVPPSHWRDVLQAVDLGDPGALRIHRCADIGEWSAEGMLLAPIMQRRVSGREVLQGVSVVPEVAPHTAYWGFGLRDVAVETGMPGCWLSEPEPIKGSEVAAWGDGNDLLGRGSGIGVAAAK